MSLKKLAGTVVVVIGIGCLGHWADRIFFRPTHTDRQFWANVADQGPELAGKPPASYLLLLGVGTIALGQHLFRK